MEATTTGSTIQNNLDYSIQHPDVFIKGDNWINSATLNSSQWKVSSCLWGDNDTAKGSNNSINPPPCTILDPAPWGTESESGKRQSMTLVLLAGVLLRRILGQGLHIVMPMLGIIYWNMSGRRQVIKIISCILVV